MTDFSNLDDEEFMEAWTEAAAELDAAKQKCKDFTEENERRLFEAKMNDMPDAERERLLQYVSAQGVESEETVNHG